MGGGSFHRALQLLLSQQAGINIRRISSLKVYTEKCVKCVSCKCDVRKKIL